MKKDGKKDSQKDDKKKRTISQKVIESYLKNWDDPRIIWPRVIL